MGGVWAAGVPSGLPLLLVVGAGDPSSPVPCLLWVPVQIKQQSRT